MDTSQVTNATSSQSTRGHHHHGGNITDMISKMSTGIDDAVKAGKLTDDQAAEMKKTLDAISEKLKSDPSGKGTQLSQDDRQQIRKQLHEIGKELHAALAPQQSDGAQGDLASELFKKIDTNGDKKIDKDEFTSFINNLKDNNGGTAAASTTPNQKFSFTMTTETKSTFSITA